jgi:opacity protein-like surface antigen
VIGEGDSARWTKLGAAWAHKDGEGFNIQLNFMPLGAEGRFVVRKVKPKAEVPAAA